MKVLDPYLLPLAGTSLIEASAGTGKTYTLATLYLRLLIEGGLAPSEILVVTYTQAATAELRERIRARILEAIRYQDREEGVELEVDEDLERIAELARSRIAAGSTGDPLRAALQDFDEAAIYTIHSFCQRTLRDNAFESGVALDAELVDSATELDRALVQDLWASLLEGEDDSFVRWLIAGEGKAWGFQPDKLSRELFQQLGADEEMPVVPDSVEGVEATAPEACRAASEALAPCWRRVLDLWVADRDVLAAWLVEGDDLKRNRYVSKTISEKWIPGLDGFVRALESPDAVLPGRPDWLAKLTTESIREGLKKNHEPMKHAFFEACDALEAAFLEQRALFEIRALGLRRRFVDGARAAARDRRERKHQLFFDDLLSELRRALTGDGGKALAQTLIRRYPFALIDEFQDTDPVQYEIFRRVWHRGAGGSPEAGSGTSGLVLIGDPKQAIYSFRGADIYTYLEARRDAGDSTFGLGTNWRSAPGLVSGVNTLFGRASNAFGLPEIDFEPVASRSGGEPVLDAPGRSNAGIRVLSVGAEACAAATGLEIKKEIPLRVGRTTVLESVARDIADLLDSGARIGDRPATPGDIAILCRTRNELARTRRVLEGLGLPCIDRSDSTVFGTEEASELAVVLRAMLRFGDPASVRAALATAAGGLCAQELATLDDESDALARASERFASYGREWSQSGFIRAFESWRRAEGVTPRLLALDRGERRLTNWLHLADLLQRRMVERAPSRTGLVDWLERAIVDPNAAHGLGNEAALLRLERDDEAITLITLHGSKGLEYEIVYLPSLWEKWTGQFDAKEKTAKSKERGRVPVRFNDAERGLRTLDLDGPDYEEHALQSIQERFAEFLRLLYVGLTRAREQCVIAWGRIGSDAGASPMAWLLADEDFAGDLAEHEAFAKAMKARSDEDWRAVWESIAEQAEEGALVVEEAVFGARPRWVSPAPRASQLVEPRIDHAVTRARVTTSFSGLIRQTSSAPVILSGPTVVGRDLDAETVQSGASVTEPNELRGGMDTFPRGAEAGTLLHEVLEQVDFGAIDRAALMERARSALDRSTLDTELVEGVMHVVDVVAHTPLRTEPGVFSLSMVARGALRVEMEFTLAARDVSGARGLTATALSELLAGAPAGSPLERYAERLGRLDWPSLRGYLRGFIDAVFFDGERYFLVDYKSNYLGNRLDDYRPEALVEPMLDHDYVLQYLVYSIALHRYLGRTLADYQYERDFGGAYYLFLRGMHPDHPEGCGVFFDRPSAELVEAASLLLDGLAPGRAA